MPGYIALLRGINVGGHNKVPMGDLRSLCAELGWTNVRTYIQSGNVIFDAAGGATSALEANLDAALERKFGRPIASIVRTAATWPRYVRGNPFPAQSRTQPNLVMLALSRRPPQRSAVDELLARAQGGERIARVGDAIWIHFASGSARSKLTPALLDRLVGSPVTTRNWRTVLKLAELSTAAANA